MYVLKTIRSQRRFRLAMWIALPALLLTQFNNCGNVAQSMDGLESASMLSCETADCVTPNANALQVQANVGNGTYSVPASLIEFNIGGDCNEGGFRYNTIHWDLVLNGTVVRNSSQNIVGSPVDEVCVNGRFRIYVYLGPLQGIDPVDRTGLNTGAGRSNYYLYITIFGQDSAGVRNPMNSRRATLPLQAI